MYKSSNNSLSQSVCAICACELFSNDMETLPLTSIPHSELLKPTHPHSAHTLMTNMLLEEESVEKTGDGLFNIHACQNCL